MSSNTSTYIQVLPVGIFLLSLVSYVLFDPLAIAQLVTGFAAAIANMSNFKSHDPKLASRLVECEFNHRNAMLMNNVVGSLLAVSTMIAAILAYRKELARKHVLGLALLNILCAFFAVAIKVTCPLDLVSECFKLILDAAVVSSKERTIMKRESDFFSWLATSYVLIAALQGICAFASFILFLMLREDSNGKPFVPYNGNPNPLPPASNSYPAHAYQPPSYPSNAFPPSNSYPLQTYR